MVIDIVNAGHTAAGTVRLSYWDTGDKYRYRTIVDESLSLPSEQGPALMPSTDIAFDGASFRYWSMSSDVMTKTQREPADLLVAVPSPFALPVAVLLPGMDDCVVACKKGLRELHQALSGQGGKATQKHFEQLKVRTKMVGGINVPNRISGKSAGNRYVINLRNFKWAGRTVLLPRRQSMIVRAPGGEKLRAVFLITEVTLNEPIDDSIFTPEVPESVAVWDEDHESRDDFFERIKRKGLDLKKY